MPRKASFTKENIITAAIKIIREQGSEALSARSICKEMNCSVSPLFTIYKNMEEISIDVRKAAEDIFSKYVADVTDYLPAFKEFGIRLVQFSKIEPNLFHYIFLEKGSNTVSSDEKALECLKQTEAAFGLTKEQAEFLYHQLWPFSCGLAHLCNKNPEIYTDDMISQMLTTQFMALLMLIKSGKEVTNITPHILTEEEKEKLNIV